MFGIAVDVTGDYPHLTFHLGAPPPATSVVDAELATNLV